MSDQTPTPMPTADARQALDALLGHRVRATVDRRTGAGPDVITGVLIHDGLYAARDATVRYPEADVHVDCMNLISVEEAAPDITAEQAALSMRERALQVARDHRDELDGEFRVIEKIAALPLVEDDTDPARVHAATPEGITPCGLGAWDVPAETDLDAVDCLACLRTLAQSPAQEDDDGDPRDRIAVAIERKIREHPMPASKPWDPPGMAAYFGCSFADLADAVMEALGVHGRSADDGPDAWDFSRMEHEADKAADRIRALEEQRAAVRSVLATWEHRTHHGDSGPMDLLADLQAAVRTRPAADTTIAQEDPAATWPSRAARRLADDARPTAEGSAT